MNIVITISCTDEGIVDHRDIVYEHRTFHPLLEASNLKVFGARIPVLQIRTQRGIIEHLTLIDTLTKIRWSKHSQMLFMITESELFVRPMLHVVSDINRKYTDRITDNACTSQIAS
eukprot:COSAG02_NODE_11777_length_1656_cov_1.764933_2_plen_116_part_00